MNKVMTLNKTKHGDTDIRYKAHTSVLSSFIYVVFTVCFFVQYAKVVFKVKIKKNFESYMLGTLENPSV